MLVAIEKDEANVSLSTLDRLADALGCSLSELVRPPSAPDSRHIDTLVWSGAQNDSRGVLLGTAPATREAEMWIWSLTEGERYPSEAGSENWHEMLLVIEGVLAIEFEERRQMIATDDFLIFSSARPYVFVNDGKGIVRFVRNVIL
jgi:transcriptional regulator with XRE-family HTH domain